ncbi:MAG: UDP-glucose 4-epimerase GalE [Clostridiales bacterium]|nr:UDP-glucose 4-epimerase GalE [Clostridiales bacterium]
MSILVCGGAGYVGSHCLEALTAAGYDCIVADNLSRGHRQAVGEAPLYVGDIADGAFLDRIFTENRVEAVLHFAASSQVGESMANPILYYENNLCATVALIKGMLRHGVKKIVFSSSAAVYGEPETVPIREESPKVPTNTYGETKLAMERFMHWCDVAYGLKYISLRYFNAAGASPGGLIGEDHTPETHLIPLVLWAAQGKREKVSIYGEDYPTPDGTCIRDYIHTSDLAEAHKLALQRLLAGGESDIFNLGSEHGLSVREIIDTARRVTGVDFPVEVAPRRAGDPAVLVASNRKAREVLGWVPRYSDAEQILSSAWKWHLSHPNGFGE